MSYELFDIKDRETHEYIRDLTREQLAQYVLGQLPGHDKGGNFRKYEPLRDEVHHHIHLDDGTVYYDSVEIPQNKKQEVICLAHDLYAKLSSGEISVYGAYERLASEGYKETDFSYGDYGYHLYRMKDSPAGFYIRVNYSLIPKGVESFYGISCGDCVNTYEYKEVACPRNHA